MSEEVRNVIIIGGGPAGYTAAIYNARAALNPLVLAGYQAGGQLMITNDVENYPGFPEGIMGPKLMEDMYNQAKRFGAEILNEDVTEVDFSQKPFTVKTYDKTFKAHSVIVATGASARWLGLEDEEQLKGGGLSACATCDGSLFKGKVVGVVGGGDSAVEEALYLTRHATKVYMFHRRDELRASKIMQERALNNENIEIQWNTVVKKYNYTKDGFIVTLNSVELEDTKTGETRTLELDGLFIAIGHDPATNFLGGGLDLDSEGYIVTKSHTMTAIEGVFAAGDVVDKRYRQAVTAAGDGCRAALDVEHYLGDKGLI